VSNQVTGLGLGAVFTIFFITLGPLKLLGPFAQRTHTLDAGALRASALRAFTLGLIAVIVGGYVGTALAKNWHVSVPALLIATGIIFFLAALSVVMAPYSAVHAEAAPLPTDPMAAALQLTFPLIVTPYGIAALIAVFAAGREATPTQIYVLLGVVMLLNLLTMLFVRQIMRPPVLLVLQLVGAVLGILQVALAVQIVIRGLRELGVLALP